MNSPLRPADATAILDLNDDCLLQTFKHLGLLSLCDIADVRNRFRENAKECFKYSKKTKLCIVDDITSDGDTVHQFY